MENLITTRTRTMFVAIARGSGDPFLGLTNYNVIPLVIVSFVNINCNIVNSELIGVPMR